jgi:hypothetical protein
MALVRDTILASIFPESEGVIERSLAFGQVLSYGGSE